MPILRLMSHINPEEAEWAIPFHHASAARTAFCIVGSDYTGAPEDLPTACDEFLSTFNDHFGDALDSQITLGPCTVRARPPFTADPIAASGSATFSDGTTSDVAPSNCAVLLKKGTARGGRKGRGRLYLPWAVGEGQVTDVGTLDPALVASYNSRAASWLANPDATGVSELLLLHTDAADGLGNPLTSLVCDPLLATQRRRLGR